MKENYTTLFNDNIKLQDVNVNKDHMISQLNSQVKLKDLSITNLNAENANLKFENGDAKLKAENIKFKRR